MINNHDCEKAINPIQADVWFTDNIWYFLESSRLLFNNLHKILANLQNFKYLCNFKLLTKNVQKQIVSEILFWKKLNSNGWK